LATRCLPVSRQLLEHLQVFALLPQFALHKGVAKGDFLKAWNILVEIHKILSEHIHRVSCQRRSFGKVCLIRAHNGIRVASATLAASRAADL
jgi:hypothetical protein